MPRHNRVDPFGDLNAVTARGMFTGNRGCLVDESGEVVRHHNGSLWIACAISYKDWSHPLDAPRTWTPLFFLDDAVALAAGHRPCGLCRRDAYESYRGAVAAATSGEVVGAASINRRLALQRLAGGRGLTRRDDRILWNANPASLPTGTVVVVNDDAHLITSQGLHRFAFTGWEEPTVYEESSVQVLTPQLSVEALVHGFELVLHMSVD
ncbi:MAG: hypothetical protein ACR2N2_00585 [Acidimicrobiia bacterium]